MRLKAVLFDLYGTLAYTESSITEDDASEFLSKRGYDVYPQAFKAAWQYVSFIDHPKYGYQTWEMFLKQVSRRLHIRPDARTLRGLARLYEQTQWGLFPDSEEAIARAKDVELKTAIITTIAKFKYEKTLKPIIDKLDLVVDGYTFHCEKSNPRIYLETLKALGVKASESIMIGDDVKLDILLPKKLGMKTILLDRSGQFSGDRTKADAAVTSLNLAIDKIFRAF
jgi:FMN phosphatase YigB (HAD superfamily)